VFTPKDLELLQPLQYKHPLLPIGADRRGAGKKKKKAPVNKNGLLLSGWTRHEGFTTKELWSHPHAIAIGVRCDNIFCLDNDGESAGVKADELSLTGGEPTWEIRRDSSPHYWKRVFAPTPEQLAAIPKNKFGEKSFSFKIYTSTPESSKQEALEFFGATTGRQVIVIGDHYESGGRYFWPEGCSPEALRPPTVDEWSRVLRILKEYAGESLPRPSVVTKNKTDWEIMDECEICGRSQRQVCSISGDGQVISCFHGITYKPPMGLRKGELVHGKWGFSSTQERSFGTFSVFVKHKPSQQELLQRRLYNIV